MVPPRVASAPRFPGLTGQGGAGPVRGELERLLDHPLVSAMLEALPGYALVLTPERRLVSAAPKALEELGLTTPESLQGLRAGELFQ